MVLPGWLADGAAKLIQRAPHGPWIPAEVSFTELPATTEEITVPTRHGPLRAIRYSPPSGAAGRGVYLNLHGGGFVIRHPEQDDALCRFIAFHADVTVINLDYIPAPQSRFPGPVEQAYDVAAWAAAPERPWDGSRLALGGQSAGGALAAAAARLAFEGGTPEVALQVLMYPALDLSIPAAQKWSPGQEKFLVRLGPVFNSAYCPDVRLRADRLASPAGTADTASLGGIAPALVISAEQDILREEAGRYAQRLRAADALIEHLDLRGVGHAFNMGGAGPDVVVPVYEKIVESVQLVFA